MDEPVSKTKKKQEAEHLKKVGVAFIELSVAKLDSLPLTDSLRKAIIDAKLIKSHGAKRRQAQLIGKLMRSADYDAILNAYEQILAEDSAVTADFHATETWRDQLITQDKEALTRFIDIYQPKDLQQLKQLIKKARDEREKQTGSKAAKALFRYLRSVIK